MAALPTSERERVLGLLRRHGWNSTSFQVLEQGFAYWFDPKVDGFAMEIDQPLTLMETKEARERIAAFFAARK